MLFFACPACNRCECDCGVLPYTVDLTFSGFVNKTASGACAITLESCFGIGAEGVVTSPGGCPTDSPDACIGFCGENDDDRGPVAAVAVTRGGSCYAKVGRVAPSITATARPSDSGSGSDAAELTVNLAAADTELCSGASGKSVTIPHWSVESVTVTGGSGYAGGEKVTFRATDEDTVEIRAAGTIIASGGVPTGVEITNAGRYYRESKDAPAIVSPVWGEPSLSSCLGWGAKISGKVDGDPMSPTFGEVVGLTIEAGGDGYQAWKWVRTCLERLNGQTVTLRAVIARPLVSVEVQSCYGSGACIQVVPMGERFLPHFQFFGAGSATPWKGTLRGCGGSITHETKMGYEDEAELLPVWSVTSITAQGGEKYFGGPLYIADENMMTGERLNCNRRGVQPAGEISVDGSGAMTGATITNPGAFYGEREYDGSPSPIRQVTLAAGGSGYAKIGRAEPSITIAAPQGVAGVTLTPTLASKKDDCDVDYWYIKSVKVAGGDGTQSGRASVTAEAAATVAEAAKVRLVADADAGVSRAVVETPGKYWREDKSLPAYVADHEVTIRQIAPSNGAGAVIGVTIDSDPNSPTFGTITKAAIINGGGGYTLLGQAGCSYDGHCLGFTSGGRDHPVEVTAVAHASDLVPIMGASGLTGARPTGVFSAESMGGYCREYTGEASWKYGPGEGASATITLPGGKYDSACRPIGCDLTCPYVPLLDVTAVLTTRTGEQITLTRDDSTWAAVYYETDWGYVSGVSWNWSRAGEDGTFDTYSVAVSCDRGLIVASGGWAGFPGPFDENGVPLCLCTSADGCGALACGPGDWFVGEIEFDINYYEDPSLPCTQCPPTIGSVRVIITKPAEPPC